jgi:hypothetical protein
VGGGTLPEHDHRKTYLNFRNSIITLYKNLPSSRLFPVLFPRFMLDYISLVQFIARFEFMNFYSVLRAHLSLVRRYGTIRKHRRNTLALCKPVVHPEMYGKSIVYDFFIRGKKRFNSLNF